VNWLGVAAFGCVIGWSSAGPVRPSVRIALVLFGGLAATLVAIQLFASATPALIPLAVIGGASLRSGLDVALGASAKRRSEA
jgi:hypothetical protein